MKDIKFPFYKQLDSMDCGPTCLKMIAKFYGKLYSTDYLREKAFITRQGVSASGIIDAADHIGMHAIAISTSYNSLRDDVPLPCIAHWRQRHFVVIYQINTEFVFVSDPAFGKIRYNKTDFLKGWIGEKFLEDSEGTLILLEPTSEFNHLEDNIKKASLGLKFIYPYLRPFKSYLIQLLLGLFVGSLLQLTLPFLTQSIVDYGIKYQNLNFINLILIGQIMLFASQASISIIRSWLLLHLGSRINITIASEFLNKLIKLPMSFFDSKITGDIMQRVEDNKRIESFLSANSLSLIFSAFNTIIFLVILFYYNSTIGGIFLFSSILYVVWILMFARKRAELDYRRFDESSGNSSSLIQIVSGITEIKLNNSEKRRRWDWESIQIKLFKISVKSLSISTYQSAGGFFINEIKNIVITYLAAKSVLNGELTLGMMLAIQYIIGQLNTPLNNLIYFVQGAQDAKMSLERIGEIHDKENEDKNHEQKLDFLPSDKSITISNLTFRYGGPSSSIILNDLSFSIPEGKVTAIVGASGSGKTTLLKLLLKLYKPTSGSIRIGKTPLDNIDTKVWRSGCGVVMQDGYIFTDTILRNITESDSEKILDKEKLQKAVSIAHVEEFVEALPSGYNSKIGGQGTSGINLSGGQKQRMLIARAIYKNPFYLIFDEATSSLDANNERAIMEQLEEYSKGKTVLIVAHRLSTVKKADQIIVMEKGAVIECGTHKELAERKGAYFTLVKNQLELGN